MSSLDHECRDITRKAGLKLLWSDSLGAKSFSFYIGLTSSKGVLIDPGAAAMQPSYPLREDVKTRLREEALIKISNACLSANTIVITHYHYDHYIPVREGNYEYISKCYIGKHLIIKNPNLYINESQWFRAREFIRGILKMLKADINNYMVKPQISTSEIVDPTDELSYALSKDYGSYSRRREELLRRGREWFNKLVNNLWLRNRWITDGIRLINGTMISFGDGKKYEIFNIILNILNPWFHGVEYDKTGWVVPIIIKVGNYTLFYTSDVMGPIIEDYAEYISKSKPDIILLDGPPTYLYPYMLNKINLRRAIDNAITLIKSKPKLIIYEHHLLRERKWRLRVQEVFKEAVKEGVPLLTVAECLGMKPLIDTL